MDRPDPELDRLVHRSRLMDLAQDILIVLDLAGNILDVNEAAAQLHGIAVKDLIGTSCATFLDSKSADHMLRVAVGMYASGVDCTDTMRLETQNQRGETVHVELRVSYSVDDRKFYVVERDVTEQINRTRELEAMSSELRRRAVTDSLTGVPNRAGFEERVATVEAADEKAWLSILDVDRFKAVNDTHGHGVGDRLLVNLAERVSSAIGPGDLLARIGGDEFAIVSPPDCETSYRERLAGIAKVVNTTMLVGDVRLASTCSVGAAQRQSGEATFNWVRRSDRNMYAEKHARSPGISTR